jgi:PAS domain-containing protein
MAMKLLETDLVSAGSIRDSEPYGPQRRRAAWGLEYVSTPEYRFLRLIEPLQDAALVLNRGGCVHSCNELFAGLIGSPRSIILGQTFDSYLVNDEEAAFRRLLASALAGTACAEFGLLHMDNSVIHVRIALRALPVEAGTSPLTCATVHPLPKSVGTSRPLANTTLHPSATVDRHPSE